MKIILLRHGKPDLTASKNISPYEFIQWIKDYDGTELCSSSLPPETTIEQVKASSLLICSALRRSINSAKALKSTQDLISNAMFNEADMPSTTWQFPKLPAQIWAIIFRLSWRMGFTAGGKVESFKQTTNRAKTAASELIRYAESHDEIILVGHGIFNRLLAQQLKKSHWSQIKPLSNGYWSHGIFEKRN